MRDKTVEYNGAMRLEMPNGRARQQLATPCTRWGVKFAATWMAVFFIFKWYGLHFLFITARKHSRLLSLRPLPEDIDERRLQKRVVSVLRYEVLMVLPSLYIYYRIMELANTLNGTAVRSYEVVPKPKSLQVHCRWATLLMIFMAHVMYLHYWWAWMWPRLWVYAASLVHGYWMHLTILFHAI